VLFEATLFVFLAAATGAWVVSVYSHLNYRQSIDSKSTSSGTDKRLYDA